MGFVSATRMALTLDGHALRAFQLGHVAVSANSTSAEVSCLFDALHHHLDDDADADVIIGFPAPATAPHLLGHGWRSAVRLQWYRRLILPGTKGPRLRPEAPRRNSIDAPEGFVLGPDSQLAAWRARLRDTPVLVYRFDAGAAPVEFELRVNHRPRRARELVVGSVRAPAVDLATWSSAVGDCVRAARASRLAGSISVAVNPLADSPPVFALRASHFAPTRSSLGLVARTHPDRKELLARVADPSAWRVGASAVPTW
jgi:hypothetical protein